MHSVKDVKREYRMLQRKIKQVECFPIQLTIDRVDLVIQKANRFEGGQED